jgi:hypothetical protein
VLFKLESNTTREAEGEKKKDLSECGFFFSWSYGLIYQWSRFFQLGMKSSQTASRCILLSPNTVSVLISPVRYLLPGNGISHSRAS